MEPSFSEFVFGPPGQRKISYVGLVFVFVILFRAITEFHLPISWWAGRGELAVALGISIAFVGGLTNQGYLTSYLLTVLYEYSAATTAAYSATAGASGTTFFALQGFLFFLLFFALLSVPVSLLGFLPGLYINRTLSAR